MKALLLVFLAGGLGSTARYGLSFLSPANGQFPAGTFLANLAACLLAGFASGWLSSRAPLNAEMKLTVLTGFCGGFSTFSTFSVETLNLWQQGNAAMAVIYVVASLGACIAGCAVGWWLTKSSV